MPDDTLLKSRLNEYLLEEVLGKGPNSTVYRATRTGDDRIFVVKVFPRDLAQDRFFAPKFEREVRELARLQHDNIVPILASGQGRGYPFIVMAYEPGGSLAARLKEEGPLSVEETARVVGRVAAALDAAHENGVLHRRVQPSNILFDEEGRAMLSDFSLATVRAALVEWTDVSSVGSSGYTAPELVRGDKEADAAADNYALGVTLFEMLTGQVPYRASNAVQQLMQHVTAPVPSVREFNEDIPNAVDAVVRRALSKEPERRYKKAGDLADAFATAAEVAPDPETTAVVIPTVIAPLPDASAEDDSVANMIGDAISGGGNGSGKEPPDEPAASEPSEPPASSASPSTPLKQEAPAKKVSERKAQRQARREAKAKQKAARQARRTRREWPWYAVVGSLILLAAAWFAFGLIVGMRGREQTELAQLAVDEQTQTPVAGTSAAGATGTRSAQLGVLSTATRQAEVAELTATASAPSATPTPTVTPSPSPTITSTPYAGGGGLLAYTSERDGDVEIFLLDPMTGDEVRVTDNEAVDASPAWSPNGRYLAYESTNTERGRHIFVVDVGCFTSEDGCVGQSRQLTSGNRIDRYPTWSPDGEKIAFLTEAGERWAFATVTVGGEEEEITAVPGPMQLFAWTPDDDLIFFGLNLRGSYELQRLAVGADPLDRVPLTASGGSVETVSYSPDYETVVYSALIGQYRHLFLADATCQYFDQCVIRRLTDDPYSYLTPDLSPDGTLIVTAANRSGVYDLYVLDEDGDIVRRLTDRPSDAAEPAWQPERTR